MGGGLDMNLLFWGELHPLKRCTEVLPRSTCEFGNSVPVVKTRSYGSRAGPLPSMTSVPYEGRGHRDTHTEEKAKRWQRQKLE